MNEKPNVRPLVLVMEDAKNVLLNTVITIRDQTGLPPSILDGIISGILADIRKESCSEISLAAARERQELLKPVEEPVEEAKKED